MEITEARERNVLILAVNGNLDSHTSPAFEKVLLPKVEGDEKFVLIDGTNLKYISSAGLRSVFKAVQKLSPKKGKLGFCSLASNVREVFEIAGFTGVISISPDKETALRQLLK